MTATPRFGAPGCLCSKVTYEAGVVYKTARRCPYHGGLWVGPPSLDAKRQTLRELTNRLHDFLNGDSIADARIGFAMLERARDTAHELARELDSVVATESPEALLVDVLDLLRTIYRENGGRRTKILLNRGEITLKVTERGVQTLREYFGEDF